MRIEAENNPLEPDDQDERNASEWEDVFPPVAKPTQDGPVRIVPEPYTREAWLKKRETLGIGASEAAAALGLSPWTSALTLWRQKVGETEAPDLSGNEAVSRGVRMEPALRTLFAAMHPELTVSYHPFDMLQNPDVPWLFATLDGEYFNGTGRRGVVEFKASEPKGKAGWDAWNGQIHQHYYIQLLAQLICTGYDEATLFAALFSRSEVVIRSYTLERTDCFADMEYVKDGTKKFWSCVQERRIPPTTIIF